MRGLPHYGGSLTELRRNTTRTWRSTLSASIEVAGFPLTTTQKHLEARCLRRATDAIAAGEDPEPYLAAARAERERKLEDARRERDQGDGRVLRLCG